MAIPPQWRPFRQDGSGAIDASVATALSNQSDTASEISSALTKGLTRSENFAGTSRENVIFRAETTGAGSTRVKHNMAANPKHVVVSSLARTDGSPLAVWSNSWSIVSNGLVEIVFQGLVASTQYTFNVLFE